MTDVVEKGFFSSDRERLIQDPALARNVDPRRRLSRFDCCIFLFHIFRAATFSTASVMSRRTQCEHIWSALPPKAAVRADIAGCRRSAMSRPEQVQQRA